MGDSSLHEVTVAGSRHWFLARVPQSIAMQARGRNVRSSIRTAILSSRKVFGGALHLARLTSANSVLAGKFRWFSDTHFASAVVTKLKLDHIGQGAKAHNSRFHGFDGPSWPPLPRLRTGGEPAVNHQLGLSALASKRGPGYIIVRTSEDWSPVDVILSNSCCRSSRQCRGLHAGLALPGVY
jgi:hypothetical protein